MAIPYPMSTVRRAVVHPGMTRKEYEALTSSMPVDTKLSDLHGPLAPQQYLLGLLST